MRLIDIYTKLEKEFLEDLEREFRRQIEAVMSKTRVTHIDSHQHIHSIPKIFIIVIYTNSRVLLSNSPKSGISLQQYNCETSS